MKSHHVIIVVVVLILLAVLIFTAKDKDQIINVNVEDSNENTEPVTNNMPVLGIEGQGVTEMIVVKEFTVSAKNFDFSPSTITVNKGDRVKIIFKNSEGFHDFKIDEYQVATSQLRAPGEEILEFTANKAGNFEFYCSVGTHRQMGMKGTLVVK